MLEFARHRTQLADKIPPGTIVLVPSAKLVTRNRDVEYPFRQNSDFFYLTGFDEPDCLAVLKKDQSGELKYFLFSQAKDRMQEIWHGERAGQDKAKSEFGADEAFTTDEMANEMPKMLLGTNKIIAPWSTQTHLFKSIKKWLEQAKGINKDRLDLPTEYHDASQTLHELRLIKSHTEIEHMRKAAQISAKAHIRLMQLCTPGMMEYELQAEHDCFVRKMGCNGVAYDSIVASGANACTLHYTQNNKQINHGDLVLIDAAGEYNYYAADITRTFPANGRFTPEQKALYEVVLSAQKKGIAAVNPGITFKSLDEIITKELVKGLLTIGLLKGTIKQNLKDNTIRDFYPHGFGHWLGLDVHDVGQYYHNSNSRVLQENMHFTIEPGLYIQPDNTKVPKKWRGLGVRIEDDILVTASGCEVLSSEAPKEVDEIESLMENVAKPVLQFQPREPVEESASVSELLPTHSYNLRSRKNLST